MTFRDLRRKIEFLHYLGFEDSRKMWVYAYQDIHNKTRIYGLILGQDVKELSCLTGLKLVKA